MRPGLLNSVIEEKMSRISEVLIGSVTPFQLMMGKLIGGVGVSVLLAAIYIAGGLVIARYLGRLRDAVTAGHARLVPAVPGDGDVHVRGRVHRDRRGVHRPEGLPGHDDAGHDAPDAPDVHCWYSVLRAPDGTMAHGAVAGSDRSAVPDDAAISLAPARRCGRLQSAAA